MGKHYLCFTKVLNKFFAKRYSFIYMNNKSPKHIILFLSIFIYSFIGSMKAQDGEKIYRFLNLPTSARVNAMGGNNVSLVDNDLSLIFHNPALLGPELDMNFNTNYMSYVGDIGVGSAIFAKSMSDISAFAVGVNYFNYGKFRQVSDENISGGDFSSKDIAINGSYGRDLSENWRGGVTAKFIYSNYESYTSTGVGFDVGLSYYNPDQEFSYGLVLKNIGAQLSAYNDSRVALPWDIQTGITKKFNHAPIRVSLTGIYLTQWNFEKVNPANGLEADNGSFMGTLFKHLVFGVDIIPSDNFWLAVGYSPKMHSDMQILDGNKWGGWNAGAGIRVNKFSIGFAFAQYHPSATSYQFSLGLDLSK